MKLIFSLLILPSILLASEVKIYHELEDQMLEAHMIKDYLIESYHIPQELIEIKKTSQCEILEKRFIEFCINKKSDLIILNVINIQNKIKSLKVFN